MNLNELKELLWLEKLFILSIVLALGCGIYAGYVLNVLIP